MIQDIGPSVFSNAYEPEPPTAESYVLSFKGREVLVAERDGMIEFPRFAELAALNQNLCEQCTYLFSVDNDRFYLAEELVYSAAYHMAGTQMFRTAMPKQLAFAGITGFQLYNWYRNHRFCGRCGQLMRPDENERLLRCGECENMEYPKISPAVIVAVTHGDRLLMSKYANREFKKYALLAGFTEIGETIEQTVQREVREEVGLKVKNLRYYKSQPWSFTDTLLLGFFVELDGDEEITLDRQELALAEWFERADIPVDDSTISLTREMIVKFKTDGFPGK